MIYSALKSIFLSQIVIASLLPIRDHLDLPNIKLLCEHRWQFCFDTGITVCAMRVNNGTHEFKQFDNDCFLFLSNMCDHPENEFYYVDTRPCVPYVLSRRDIDIRDFKVFDKHNKIVKLKNVKVVLKPTPSTTTTTAFPKKMKRNRNSTKHSLRDDEEDDEAFDGHPCPRSCPDIYKPICLNVNRSAGKYFRLFHFLNHCKGDLYYCTTPGAFIATSTSDAAVQGSLIEYSYCSSNKYLNMARFFEYSSSLGYYGWLHNSSASATKILDPDQKVKGFGNIEIVDGKVVSNV